MRCDGQISENYPNNKKKKMSLHQFKANSDLLCKTTFGK